MYSVTERDIHWMLVSQDLESTGSSVMIPIPPIGPMIAPR